MPPQQIEDNVVVTLQYKLWLDDGEMVEESDADDPLMYLHGHDNIIPGLERALQGMRVGDKKRIVVEPEDAYGEYDPDDVEELALSALPPELNPEVGMVLAMEDSEGHEFEAVVTDLDEDTITLDFNHPMAGERLTFDVTITELREASKEELDHGHVHSGHHH
jgi:FKBP-type peptidyl-prolyl cis-trans isomerase SlyD